MTMPNKYPATPEEAIWDIHARMISLETTIRGTPNTAERGLVGTVEEVKALAVEVKNANNDQAKAVTWLQARCRAFHGESNDPKAQGDNASNPLKNVPAKRVVAFIATATLFVAMVIYNLGGLIGWWSTK